ncbi:MAG: hypothetical protein JNL74_22640 [Fibrobacteres bacterium]|nr:hypothetical protein [Fibrobacterota bacterium]
MTSYPLKVSVQTGDTLSFVPFIRGWDSTATNVNVVVSTPLHGDLQVINNWFDTISYFSNIEIDSRYYTPVRPRTPRNFPGFRYIPKTGFTGGDTFTFKITTNKDSTQTVKCAVRITPPEPGAMTVLLVVNQTLLTSIQTEVNRLKNDLENEGYKARVLPFAYSNTTAKQLWDSLVAEYDNQTRMLAGTILIGQLPYLGGNGNGSITKESAFWSMSKWQEEMDADTIRKGLSNVTGYFVGNTGYNGAHFTPGFMNIWMSRIYGLDSYGRTITTLGTEVELIKRALDNNHNYRTGASRLPQTAFSYNMYAKHITGNDGKKLLDIWPNYMQHSSNNNTHPFNFEFKQGGEIWNLVTHGNAGQFNALLNGSNGKVWDYNTSMLQNSNVSVRFLLADLCHAGGLGCIVNQHLLVKNSSCVLAMAPTDYISQGFYLWDTSATRFPPHKYTRDYLAKGERWGRSWLRGNGWIWASFYGDLSLKPKMTLPNIKPLITSVTPVMNSGMSWKFSVEAIDSDDGITAYDWYGNGYQTGKVSPDSSSQSKTFSITYNVAKICTLRVEVVDHYMARDYAEIIIKTDSGVIANNVNTSVEASSPVLKRGNTLSLRPNPFNPGTTIDLGSLFSGKGLLRFEVLSIDGRVIYQSTLSKTEKQISWNGRNNAGKPVHAGIYLFRITAESRKYEIRGMLTK